jgi:hypothetical protein
MVLRKIDLIQVEMLDKEVDVVYSPNWLREYPQADASTTTKYLVMDTAFILRDRALHRVTFSDKIRCNDLSAISYTSKDPLVTPIYFVRRQLPIWESERFVPIYKYIGHHLPIPIYKATADFHQESQSPSPAMMPILRIFKFHCNRRLLGIHQLATLSSGCRQQRQEQGDCKL